MAKYTAEMYINVFPVNVLDAPQVNPIQIARHHAISSAEHFPGSAVFAEFDKDCTKLNINNCLSQTIPHCESSSINTRYICSYTVSVHQFRMKKNFLKTIMSGKNTF